MNGLCHPGHTNQLMGHQRNRHSRNEVVLRAEPERFGSDVDSLVAYDAR